MDLSLFVLLSFLTFTFAIIAMTFTLTERQTKLINSDRVDEALEEFRGGQKFLTYFTISTFLTFLLSGTYLAISTIVQLFIQGG